MKRCYFTVLAYFFLLKSYSQNNQVIISGGKWNDHSTWALGHVPANGEVAIIPADSVVVVDENILVSTSITVKIFGTLSFQVGKLRLTGSSAIYLYPGGTIASDQGNASDKIEINGVSKYSGDEGSLAGPLMANAVTTGFDPMPIILPVKFIAYNISHSGANVSIKWSTTEEVNAAYYEVKRSGDGFNWLTIARVEASSKPGVVNNYSYTDKEHKIGLAYYRIKQVDKDGGFVYSSIRSIKSEPSPFLDVKVSSIANNIVVEFSKQLTGNVMIQLQNLSGQVIAKKTYYQPEGYIIFATGTYKGHFILSLSNGNEGKISKQVFLNN